MNHIKSIWWRLFRSVSVQYILHLTSYRNLSVFLGYSSKTAFTYLEDKLVYPGRTILTQIFTKTLFIVRISCGLMVHVQCNFRDAFPCDGFHENTHTQRHQVQTSEAKGYEFIYAPKPRMASFAPIFTKFTINKLFWISRVPNFIKTWFKR
jgi:hypothetical protein